MVRTKGAPVRWAAHAQAREIKKLYRKRPSDVERARARRRRRKKRRIRLARWKNPWLVAAVLVPRNEHECPFCAKYGTTTTTTP